MAGNAALLQLQKDMTDMKAMFAQLLPPTDNNKPDEKTDDLATQFAALKQSHEELLQKFNALPKPAEEKPSTDLLKDLQEKFSTMEQRLNDALKEQPGTEGGEHFNADGDLSQYI